MNSWVDDDDSLAAATAGRATAARRPPSPWLDSCVTAALGAALLAVGWLDARTYRAGRGKSPATFPFLATPGEMRLGDVEFYRGRFTWVQCENLGHLENDGERPFRHGLGPETVFEITSERTRARLSFQFFNAVAGQRLTVSYDGQVLEQLGDLPTGAVEKTYALALHPGANRFVLAYARYNHAGVELTADDGRPIAGTFFALDLALE